MRRLLVPLLVLASLPAPQALHAQDTVVVGSAAPTGRWNAPAFRAGQWAAQFGISGGFYGIGALRFSSPSTAWVFSANLRAAHNSQDRADLTSDFYSTGVSAGRRWYRPGAGRVRPFSELGLSAGYTWSKTEDAVYDSRQQGYGVGGYGQIGAMVFLAPELSVGAAWIASFGYNHEHYETNGPSSYSSDRSGVSIDAGRLQLVGALYF
ncbi:MAG TPA: outer membrane beta-barrel protein [Gemmatimonadales bacterium]|nr:outer membrane beta-barrel protein [Gemmatimonadales bacterium]